MPRFIPIVLILFIALFACGPNVTISLPNDYAVHVMNARDIAIASEHDHGHPPVKMSIGLLDTEGDHVFGEIVEPESRLFNEYFILDTTTGRTDYYPSRQPWTAALNTLGVTDINLRQPSAFFNLSPHFWWRLVLFTLIILTGTTILLVRRSKEIAANSCHPVHR